MIHLQSDNFRVMVINEASVQMHYRNVVILNALFSHLSRYPQDKQLGKCLFGR